MDIYDYCQALKETSRQKSSDNSDLLDSKKLMNKIRKLEAENFVLKNENAKLRGFSNEFSDE